MPKSFEGGIRPYRLEFVRESITGETPSDPDWQPYSDNIRTFEPGITSGQEEQRGLGNVDPQDHFVGSGEFELTVTYDLQRWLVDGGSPHDAAQDGIERDSDNRLQSTHSVVRRMEQSDLDPENTVNGSSAKDTRQFVVFVGAYIDTVTVTGDPTTGQPILVELSYMAEKARPYQIDQPGTDDTLDIVSTDDNDTMDITLEDEGAATSETITLTGTTTVSSTETFSDLDAVELSEEAEGDVTVSETTSGDDLAVIRGKASYDFDEGDLGVPALGSGSHGGTVGSSYEVFQGDTVERPGGTSVGDEINSTELTVENDVDVQETSKGQTNALVAQGRTAQVSATVFGEVEAFDKLMDSLENIGNDLVWTFSGGTVTLTDAHITETDPSSEEASQGVREVDVTFNAEGITVA